KELRLSEIFFKEDKIEKGWLDGISLKFTHLTIKKSVLSDLGEGVFSGGPFTSYMTKLTLEDIPIKSLRRNMFLNAKIESLEIRYSGLTMLTLEENTFAEISGSLRTLQLQQCIKNSEDIINATGSKADPLSVTELTLQDNDIRVLQADSFTSVSNLNTLYLDRSNILEIKPGTLDFLHLEMLTLVANKLQTLPKGIFDNMKGGINIKENKWRCDCDFTWFRDFYSSQRKLFSDIFYCFINNTDIYYENVNFCSETTSTSHFTTTSMTTTDSSDNSPVNINCRDTDLTENFFKMTSCDKVQVRNETVIMELLEAGDRYALRIIGDVLANNKLIWFNSRDRSRHGCECNLSKTIPLNDFFNEETYTVCLMNNESNTVSPFDCAGLTIPPKWENQTWISNRLISIVICAICGSLLTAVLVSALIMFYCIRQHPNLIKGNKRVIIVGSKATDAIVMPKPYDELNYTPPSFNSGSGGYLTPVNQNYDQVRSSSVLRTISKNTTFDIPSTSYPLGRMKKNQVRRVKLQHVAQTFDDHVYEPPPLPPNHPSEWIYNTSINSYSRV
ncbi:LRR 8 domain containing protein, partial [Asbolus verrucosus]